jgi:hypothetical protein
MKYLLSLMFCSVLLISFCSINLRLKTENRSARLAIKLASILIFIGVSVLMISTLFVLSHAVRFYVEEVANLINGAGVGMFACVKIYQQPGEESPYRLKPPNRWWQGRR